MDQNSQHMDNTISTNQNLEQNINCLAAQRTIYSTAKRITAIQIILGVLLIVIISIATLILNNEIMSSKLGFPKIDISWIGAFIGVSVTVVDIIFLNPSVVSLKEKAARIQELFDTKVLGIPWNDVLIGEKPAYEQINKFATPIKNDKQKLDKLSDWYSNKLDGLPSYVSTIICQRSNLWWDAELRKFFSNIITGTASMLVFALLLVGVYTGLTIKSFFLIVLAPSLPIIIFATRQRIDNLEALKQLTSLKNFTLSLWQEFLSNQKEKEYLVERIRQLQDQIYYNRKNNPLIFDWVYNLKKTAQHEDMYYSVDQMIDDYKNAYNAN